MIKLHNFFLLLFIVLLVHSCDKESKIEKKEQYVIIGHFTGFPDDATIYLKNLSTDANIDSAKVQDGLFQLKGKLSNPPEQLWITSEVEGQSIYTNLLIGNDSIWLSGDINDFPWHIMKNGPQIQEEYNEARSFTKRYEIERDTLVSFFLALSPEQQQARGKEIWSRIDKIDSIILVKRVQYVKGNSTYVSLIDLGYLRDELLNETINLIFRKYPEEIKNSKYGNIIKTYLKKSVVTVGDTFYDFEGINQKNQKISLSRIMSEGKFTLLDFTSAFCGVSIKATDELSRVQKRYSDYLTIVSFSGDPQKESWLKGVERDSVGWNSVWDGQGRFSETAIIYGVAGFPTFVLINPDGKIVDRWTGYEEGKIVNRLNQHLQL